MAIPRLAKNDREWSKIQNQWHAHIGKIDLSTIAIVLCRAACLNNFDFDKKKYH